MSEIETFAKSIVTQAVKKLSPISFLSAQVRRMEREDVEYLATAWLLSQVKTRQRHAVAAIEREASQKRQDDFAAIINSPEMVASRLQSQRDMEAKMAQTNSEFWQRLTGIMDDYKRELRTEWTNELLASEFALGDGTSVRWGDATREQHQYRLDMHKKNAIAGFEGAARHQEAIDALDEAGASTLYEATREAA